MAIALVCTNKRCAFLSYFFLFSQHRLTAVPHTLRTLTKAAQTHTANSFDPPATFLPLLAVHVAGVSGVAAAADVAVAVAVAAGNGGEAKHW